MIEREILEKFVLRDRGAFDVLVREYAPIVYAFLFRYLGSRVNAEDLSQEVFLRAWTSAKSFDTDKNFKTWILTIAKNAALDFLKKKKEIPFSFFESDEGANAIEEAIADDEPLPNELLVKAQNAELLADALKKLSPKQRVVLTLHFENALTFAEIGEVLGDDNSMLLDGSVEDLVIGRALHLELRHGDGIVTPCSELLGHHRREHLVDEPLHGDRSRSRRVMRWRTRSASRSSASMRSSISPGCAA